MSRIDLVQLSPSVLSALAAGDLAAANLAAPISFSAYFVGPEWRNVWRRRAAQVADDQASAAWITRAILDVDRGLLVGRAGFHGPPNAAGMVEVGYAIDPAFRRQGYARAALIALLKWAKDDASIMTVRATISPYNLASRALVAQYGFVEVGEQWDDEDGLETIFEVDAPIE
ncbi:GNAT family N-acetyltransferase [Phenylobacterium ferrooxidans]|uniref:GNAT family N-acetyltransferase n=1 Tax=Phenylobacterium ferrooxidans TaxID=2982689 RepID=A0ABW6CY90_9CAUL